MARVVIALGGNALGSNPTEQKELVKIPAKKIVELVKQGHQVVVGHGNGPQVGMIVNSFSNEAVIKKNGFNMPFAEAGGMSQGYIGYHLQNAIYSELKKNKMDTQVQYILTQTLVDAKDSAFQNPSKPVGPFYKDEATAKAANPGSTIIDDAGRGFRKVVASPKPIDFLGIKAIKQSVENGTVVIVGGGGGIPTIAHADSYQGVDGVIDKDFALALMAEKVNADKLVILTGVSKVAINWGKPNQSNIDKANIKEMEQHIKDNQFAPGSMLPKVQAAISFVKRDPKSEAVIALLEEVDDAMKGKTGTIIVAK